MACTTSNCLQLLNELGRLLGRFVEGSWSAQVTEQATLNVMGFSYTSGSWP